MKESTRDKAKGKLHEVKGAAKEGLGRVSNNRKLRAKGVAEKLGGKAQGKIGRIEKAVGM